MGVDWMFVNETEGEYIFPAKYVNEKDPVGELYARFIVYVMMMWGSKVRTRLVCDCDYDEEIFYTYIHRKREVTDRYWNEFCEQTGYDVKAGVFKSP